MNKRQQRLLTIMRHFRVSQLEQRPNCDNPQQIGPWVVWYGELEPLRVSATVRDVHGLVRRGLLRKAQFSEGTWQAANAEKHSDDWDGCVDEAWQFLGLQ